MKGLGSMGVIPYILFIIGCIFIIKGGDLFVEAAIWIARVTGMSEVLIGATVVSVATTLPELTVSTLSNLQGQASMAIGNAVGSTICNIGLILAVSCIIRPSRIHSRFFHLKGIVLISYTLLLWGLSFKGGRIGTRDGWILLVLLASYLAIDYGIVKYKSPNRAPSLLMPMALKEWRGQFLRFLVGLVFILVGARLLVKYGIEIARFWHVPETIIALTIIAIGTSLPELVTSMTAAIKGHEDLSVGNILGANILNITLVLGVSALVGPLEVPAQSNAFDIPVSLVMGLILVVPGVVTRTISRLQGVVLLIGYLAYIAILFFVFG